MLDKKGISARELARKMRSSPATIYRILNEERGIGRRVAVKIAAALEVDQSVVLYQAGYGEHDPTNPIQKLDPITLDIVQALRGKSDAQKRAALAIVLAMTEADERGSLGRNNAATTGAATRKKSQVSG
jgi:transcriptional regulator with XRE-family HTH domain